MTFAITSRLIRKSLPVYKMPQVQIDYAARKAICNDCEYLNKNHPSGPYCHNPRCGCPAGWWRTNPWERMPSCRVGKW